MDRDVIDRIEESPAGGIAGRSVYMLHVRGSAFLWHQVPPFPIQLSHSPVLDRFHRWVLIE